MTILVIFIYLLLTFYFFLKIRQSKSQLLTHHVHMRVRHLFQERAGQCNCDRCLKGGVLIFTATDYDEQVKNIVINKVRPHNTALRVNLDHILVILLDREEISKAEVSVRFKMEERGVDISDLKGDLVSISGVLNFEYRNPQQFKVSLPIGDVYQKIETF